jgi:phosphoheptose isomerase
MNPEVIDSLLQVTPEQKAALDANRAKGDSIFRELRTQKHDAEKALGEALEKNDAAAIEAAKAKGMKVAVLTSVKGEQLIRLADAAVAAPASRFSDRIQEIHIKVIHILIDAIEHILEG